jgi:putative tryptophan/tyrosine transport system substrate-binding protein
MMGRRTLSRDRRQFLQRGLALAGISLHSACGLLPPQAPDPARVRRIGLFTPASLATTAEDRAFRQALRELGWIEGQNLRVEYRWSQAEEGLARAAAELVAARVELIVAAGNELARAAGEASRSTPVVMAVSSDPVGSGLVSGLARPGGNVTGLATLGPELSTKRLELLKETLSNLSRVVVVWDPTYVERAAEERSLRAAGGALGVEVQFRHFHTPVEFRAVVERAKSWPADALMILDDPLYESLQFVLGSQYVQVPMPTIAGYAAFAQSGGLMAYGPNIPDMFARTAGYVDKILKGARPAELPVEQPSRFELIVNLKTAKALRLAIPPSVLQQATELIQ